MAQIEGKVLTIMFEGIRRGDENTLREALNKNGEVTLKLLRNESPNLFRSIWHFEITKDPVPQEATPEEPPVDWAVHEIPELIVEKENAPKELDIIEYFNNEIPELKEEEPITNWHSQVIETSDTPLPPDDDASDLLVVEGEELVGETLSVKFPDAEEEIIVDKINDAPIVKAPKGKKAK